MEATISAILGELAGRTMSFIVDKYLKQKPAPTKGERLDSLQRLLLRARVIVDEAEDRHIANQAMMQQLSILRKEMYIGYFTLDTFRCRSHQGNKDSSFAMSQFNSAKRVRFCSSSSSSSQSLQHDLQRVVRNLESIVADMNEFVVFLSSYPRLHRQPYSMYLLLENCMFGRQTEMGYLINFLLKPAGSHGHGSQEPAGVLPVIGPGRVGKSTLVEHACKDERVQNHFSQIVLFTRTDLEDESIADLRDGGIIKHRNRSSDGGRVLVIAELDGDRYSERLDESISDGLLERLYSAYRTRIPPGSKIIIISRSEKIARLGTTTPLRLHLLTQEAYWYFFKVRTFGSMDMADLQPEMESIAMDIAMELRCFMGANTFSGFLRSNADAGFWRLVLATLREFRQRNQHVWWFRYGTADHQPVIQTDRATDHECFTIVDNYQQTGSHASLAHCKLDHEADPKISVVDVLFGKSRPRGRFDVIGWKSLIPPYYSYMYSCEIQRLKCMVTRKKRTYNNGS